jgi:hypothetical protein
MKAQVGSADVEDRMQMVLVRSRTKLNKPAFVFVASYLCVSPSFGYWDTTCTFNPLCHLVIVATSISMILRLAERK